jgi:exonuclease VII large subunit
LEHRQIAADPKLIDGLRRQLAELDREIDQAADNFLRTPTELLDVIGGKLSAMKRQREHVQQELHNAEAASKPQDVSAAVDAVISRLERLGQDIAAADPARRREVFRQLVDRIDLRFQHVQRGKRLECPVSGGEITLTVDQNGIFGSVSRGDRI